MWYKSRDEDSRETKHDPADEKRSDMDGLQIHANER